MTFRACISALLLAVPAMGSTATIPFDGKVTPLLVPWIENGITAVGGEPSSISGSVLISRIGSYAGGNAVDLTTGGLFTPESASVRSGGSGWCSESPTLFVAHGSTLPAHCDDQYLHMWFSGFVDDILVSTLGLYRPRTSEFETIDLSILGQINMLRVEAKSFFDVGIQSGGCILVYGCSEFYLDSVTLNPVEVPEPSTLLLLSGALAGMAVIRRRQRSA